ncbi:MAG: hypothetical protein WC666_02035 [Candidatus Paceibacterota bacterium]|jgi:hypothetical protein
MSKNKDLIKIVGFPPELVKAIKHRSEEFFSSCTVETEEGQRSAPRIILDMDSHFGLWQGNAASIFCDLIASRSEFKGRSPKFHIVCEFPEASNSG